MMRMHGGRGLGIGERGAARRRGVSLLEILVAIFILAVGLLGVAALIPVGHSEIMKAEIAHRSSETALRAFREMKLRGYLNPDNWLVSGSPVTDPKTNLMLDTYAGQSFVIDPLTVTNGGGGVQGIPGTNLKLITLREAPATEKEKRSAMNAAVAERVFVAQDSLLFDRPDDETLAARQFVGGETGPRRRTERLYSWMAMLTPMRVLPNGSLPAGFKLDTYLMSVVVFYRDTPDGGPRKALLMNAEPLGGTEFRFRMQAGGESDEDAKKFLRPRRWVLLVDSRQRNYRWYRIGSVQGSAAEERSDRLVSLVGPDWDRTTMGEPQAIVYEGVVGVVEKMVQLEGYTMWSPGAPNAGRR